MRLSEQQIAALEVMAIPLWVKRESTTIAAQVEQTNSVVAEQRFDVANATMGVVCELFKPQSAEHFLLTAILNSINVNIESVVFSSHEGLAQSKVSTLNQVLVFGGGNTLPVNQHWVQTYSLSQLLQQPVLKQQLWQAIKQWRR